MKTVIFLATLLILSWVHLCAQPKKFDISITDSTDLLKLPEIIKRKPNAQSIKFNAIYLKEVPACLSMLKELKYVLFLQDNIAYLPDFFSEFKNLDTIIFGYCKMLNLKQVFKKLAELPNLKHVGIFASEIVTLPNDIKYLIQVNSIDLHYNRIESLPAGFAKLKKLKELNLSHNCFNNDSIFYILQSLSHLEVLDLSDNRLKRIPITIGKMKALKRLYLSANGLTHIHKAIKNLVNLQLLVLNGNNLKEIPAALIERVKQQKLFISGVEYNLLK